MESIKQLIEWSATGIELLTVLLILAATAFGTLRFLFHLNRQVADAYKQYKVHLGKMLILALEFLVAADIIRTVVLDQTLGNVGILGLLVLIRTFLSWSLTVEIEGRWPWSKDEDEPKMEVGK
jgi:uncharacterized membrane protein